MKNKSLNYILVILFIVVIILFIYLNSNQNNDVTFTINDEKITLKVGNTTKINYSISDPNVNIVWSISDPLIATISGDGTISAKKIGTAIITGKINSGGSEKSINCFLTVHATNYDITLEDISLPDGELLLKVSDIYQIPITYIPENGYVKNIDYYVENNNIISVNDGYITALKPGYTLLRITVNDYINKEIIVNVTDKQVTSNIITPIKNFTFEKDKETIYVNDSIELKYVLEPNNGNVFAYQWESANDDIASIDEDGIITGKKSGSTTISLNINNRITKEIDITVKSKIDSINLNYSPKEILKIGDTFRLYPTITPANIKDQKIIYQSSNPNTLNVTQDGTVTARSVGTATITISNEDKTTKKTLSFTVLNNKGLINSNKTIWAFSKNTDVTPTRAGADFFTALTKKGRGTFSNNIYTYQKYSYNLSKSMLTINGKNKILMRIYYPKNKDLSTLNTFTFIGGVGETNFGGSFNNFEQKSGFNNSGIVILIPESDLAKIQAANVVEATNFVKLIINQNNHARNNIGGYSNGGPPAGDAAAKGNYDKIMLINTSFYWVEGKTNIKNIEVIVYSANNDSWRGTSSFINELYNNGFKNVTIISNSNSMINSFKDKYLVINPGSSMKDGHTSENLSLAHFFSYGID